MAAGNTTDGSKRSTGQSKSYTAPKGRPTVHKNANRGRRRLSSTLEWCIVVIVAAIVLAGIFYFGRNFTSGGNGGNGGNGGGQSGLSALDVAPIPQFNA